MKKVKYFNITQFIKENFHHSVEPFQFKRLLIGFRKVSSENDLDIFKNTGGGSSKRTVIRVEFIALFANWLLKREDKYTGKVDFNLLIYRLIFEVDTFMNYIEE